MTRFVRLALLALAAPALASAATFLVTTTSDAGPGSLRAAILNANATSGPDTISFGIPGSDVHRIVLTSVLPAITEALVIDGFTQLGSDLNTDPIGINAVLKIEVAGNVGMNGFLIHAGPSTIRGLAIFDFFGAILIDSATGPNVIESNFLGVDAAGSPMGNFAGVVLKGSSVDTVGGFGSAVRNLISASLIGVQVDSGHNKRILGNLIGTGLTGTAALGNEVGVWVKDSGASVGEADPAARNVISGNLQSGVVISGQSNASVAGNFIGPDATGFAPLGNGGRGVEAEGSGVTTIHSNVISGNGSDGVFLGAFVLGAVHLNHIGTDPVGISGMGNAGAGIRVDSAACVIGDAVEGGNTIANNQAGVWVLPGLPLYSIRANSISSNGGLGIVSGPAPVIRPNAAGSLDNFPLIMSVTSDDASTTIQGVYRGAPNCPVGIDFFASPICSRRPREFEEGERYLGSQDGQSDASGEFAFDVTLPVPLEDGRVTATATAGPCPFPLSPEGASADPKQTSQFSQRLPFSIEPSSGSVGGGTDVTIFGTDFLPGASVTIGGVPAGNVSVVGPTEMQVSSPALPAGSINDVVVTNTDGTHGTLALAWVADFLDVPPEHPFHDFVDAVVSNAIAVGTGGGNYGVEAATLRKQMAVFLGKAKHGLCFVPTGCAGVFGDVPCTSPFASWIEQLAAQGITGGCGGGNYCPDSPVTREQMAVFLLKAEHGSSYVPPPCTGAFGDVACPSLFADWIEQLAAENITSGCGGGNYCPRDPNTRGQMAVFLTKTFDLP